jgi:type I restriction enzyme M protein
MSAQTTSQKPLVFHRKAAEVDGRMDVHYNEPRWDDCYRELESVEKDYGSQSLNTVTEAFNVGLTTAGTSYYQDNGVLFLRGENVRMLDACAGSGGFLISVYEDLRRQLLSTNGDVAKRRELLKRLGRDTIFACEIEEKAARLGKLNLIIHAVDPDNARTLHQNYYFNNVCGGLKPEITFKVDFGDERREQRIGAAAFDLVMTNPPFGKAVKRESLLLDYRFGHEIRTFKTKPSEKKPRNSQDSEVLFIEHYLRILKPGGKLLIVLADGVLSNSSAKPVRDYIREHAVIKAVISLPTETFASTGSSIPTNVVYLRKKRPGDEQGDIFMARADAVGRRANGEPSPENDLPFILEKFREWQAGPSDLAVDQP